MPEPASLAGMLRGLSPYTSDAASSGSRPGWENRRPVSIGSSEGSMRRMAHALAQTYLTRDPRCLPDIVNSGSRRALGAAGS
jgi:hypothetical protein